MTQSSLQTSLRERGRRHASSMARTHNSRTHLLLKFEKEGFRGLGCGR
jgi:hypothetical protein